MPGPSTGAEACWGSSPWTLKTKGMWWWVPWPLMKMTGFLSQGIVKDTSRWGSTGVEIEGLASAKLWPPLCHMWPLPSPYALWVLVALVKQWAVGWGYLEESSSALVGPVKWGRAWSGGPSKKPSPWVLCSIILFLQLPHPQPCIWSVISCLRSWFCAWWWHEVRVSWPWVTHTLPTC